MYFWKIDNLKKDLIENSLTENEQFKYLIATIVALSATMSLTAMIDNNIWDIYFVIVGCIITIIGIIYVYLINGGSKGKYILQRIISLGWVIVIRWSVLIMLPTTIIFFTLLGGEAGESKLSDVIVINFVYLIYFWSLGRHVKEVSLKVKQKQ